MRIYIIILTIIVSFSCKEKKIPELCLENLMGESINIILADSTISLFEEASDTSFYRFLFGQGSHLPYVFHENKIQGAPLMEVDVKNGVIEKIFFYYLSIGDIVTTDDIVNNILSSHFCITKLLIPDKVNGQSNCSYIKDGIRISATHIWDVGLENIITIEYSFI